MARRFLIGAAAAAFAFATVPAFAAGDLAAAKAVVEAHTKLPTFVPPGEPFDAKKAAAGKKLLTIPVSSANPFTKNIVLAMIDEKSLDRLGRWPWPRARFAELIERLSADGAKVVAFDIGFLEPDENSQLELLDSLDERVGRLKDQSPELGTFLAESRRRADRFERITPP